MRVCKSGAGRKTTVRRRVRHSSLVSHRRLRELNMKQERGDELTEEELRSTPSLVLVSSKEASGSF